MSTVLTENVDLFRTFWEGFRTFEQTGEAPHEAWLAMRRLFVISNGWFNDIFQKYYGYNKPFSPVRSLEGSLWKGVTQPQLQEAVRCINRDGFYVFPQLLDSATIDQLLDFSFNSPVVLQSDQTFKRSIIGQDKTETKSASNEISYLGQVIETEKDTYFDPNRPLATNYRLREREIIQNLVVQKLLADPTIISLAQQYIQSQTMYTTVSMWWTTPFGCEKPSSALAQQYHFDMDRFKFIKFFLYLTDVGPGDGPHCYVKGSCKRKPKALRRDGRFSDEEIAAQYDPARLIEFCAPRGTLIAEDTRGFHKAKMPTTGNRLIFQVELASCLFGPKYPKSTLEPREESLKKLIAENPTLFANFGIGQQAPRVLVGSR
jgi:hypothetical protein